MTIHELIELLKTYPQDLPVAYPLWSEHLLLKPDKLLVKPLCVVRPDGWIQNYRPDMPSIDYLIIGE